MGVAGCVGRQTGRFTRRRGERGGDREGCATRGWGGWRVTCCVGDLGAFGCARLCSLSSAYLEKFFQIWDLNFQKTSVLGVIGYDRVLAGIARFSFFGSSRFKVQGSKLGDTLIPNRFQAETNPLIFCATGCVARSLQTAAGMRLTRALPVSQNPARLSLILKAHWNKAWTPNPGVQAGQGQSNLVKPSQTK